MRGNKSLRAAFLTRYDRTRGSSRVRVYDYLPYLERIGWECRVLPFPNRLSLRTKAGYLLQSLRLARWADVVVLQKLVLREEFTRLLKGTNRRLIFDFDDAVYTPPDMRSHDRVVQARYRLMTKRLHYILQQVRCVIAGSDYLAHYASQFHPEVYVLPSSVNIDHYALKPNSDREDGPVVLGWIGSPGNLVDFQPIGDALREAFQRLDGGVVLKVVSTHPPSLNGVPVLFEPWALEREIEFLHSFDIGLMPLNNTERSRGRCAFKAIQYMAVGLPVIASPVGTALKVVEHGKTGFLAATTEEWVEAIIHLVSDPELRLRMGLAGRARVEERYTIQINAPKFAKILQKAARK